jgi:hypothetical protein
MPTDTDRLTQISATIAVLEAQIARKKASQAEVKASLKKARTRTAEGKIKYSEDTRRKILAGAVLLGCLERGELDEAAFKRLMGENLTRQSDRDLFDID